MAGKKEINMINNKYGDNQTTNINYGNGQGDQRKIEFLKAVRDEDLSQIKMLLIANREIFDNDYKLESFMFACEENKLSAGELLWQKWKTDLMSLLKSNGVVNEHLLGAACSLKQSQDDILSNKGFMKSSDSAQRYILLNFITRGNEEMFKEAVMSGANPYLAAEDGQLLIDKARSKGFKDLVEYKDMCEAVYAGNILVTQMMLLRGDDINKKNETNLTPLHVAVSKGKMAICSFLLEHGSVVNAVNMHGFTPLHNAAIGGNIEAAQLLVKHGAAANNKNYMDEDTPLHNAAQFGRTNIVQYLLKSGADINALNKDKETALHQVITRGYIELVRTLLKAGAAVNTLDKKKMTPLDRAIYRNRQDMISLLKEHGAVRSDDMDK